MQLDAGSAKDLGNCASFFGGSVSTRQAAAAPGWRADVQQQAQLSADKSGRKGDRQARRGGAGSSKPSERAGAAPGGAAPPAREEPRRRPRASFADVDLDGCDAPAALPAPLSGAVARLAAAGSAQQKPGMATPPRRWPEPAGGSGSGLGSRGAWPAACGGSGGGAAARRGASASLTPERKGHVMIVQPRGRKGAAGRSAATMPQAAGNTRKQMADAALRGQILAMRQQRPGPGLGPGSAPSPGASRRTSAPGFVNGDARRPLGSKRRGEELDPDEAGFIEDGDDGGDGDWRAMLRAVTGGYDPARFRDEGDDRTMVASRAQIEAEERRSARMGRSEDERAAAEEARAAAAKAEKKRRRKGDSSFVLV